MGPANPNRNRAIRIARILDGTAGTDSDQEKLVDLLCDAMHWCDASGEDFHIALAQACRHYIHELYDENNDERNRL